MKRLLAAVLAMILGVALTLAAVGVLMLATRSIERMASPLLRALAIGAVLCLGVALLVGSVFLATRLAVWLSGKGPDEPLS